VSAPLEARVEALEHAVESLIEMLGERGQPAADPNDLTAFRARVRALEEQQSRKEQGS
jgi:hypothetical protein